MRADDRIEDNRFPDALGAVTGGHEGIRLSELRDAQTPLWRQWGNRLGFALRQFMGENASSRGINAYIEPVEDKSALFAGNEGVWLSELGWLKEPYRLTPTQVTRFKSLLQLYDLSAFYENSSRLRLLEVMSVLDYLDQFQQAQPFFDSSCLHQRVCCHWLDVGSKNWAYVHALWAFLNRHWRNENSTSKDNALRKIHIDGVEIDSERRYRDGYTRADYARSYINALPWPEDARYHRGDIRTWQGYPQEPGEGKFKGYPIITCFLPFVFADPHFAWGLPASRFDPSGLLQRMLALLANSGTLIITNQGEDEAQAQAALLRMARKQMAVEGFELRITAFGALPETFLPTQYKRYGFLCRKMAF
ncbi:MAG: hypothetical protein VKJ04_07020 [Vampirovibrionales bacterium]|nr:hypothetical protein [Vampirovibrionales bacterium]